MALALALGGPSAAQADPIAVTTQSDEHNVDFHCSLREAIIAANADSQGPAGDCAKGNGTDVISLPASANHYTLTLGPAGDDLSASGDLDITTSLTIAGAGAATTIIDGNQLDRVLQVVGVPTVEIRDVTITGGRTPDGSPGPAGPDNSANPGANSSGGPGTPSEDGGGILTGGALTLTRVVISGNTTGTGGKGGDGGHGGNGAAGSNGGNSTGATGGASGDGGGIAVAVTGGSLTVVDSTIAQNTTGTGGASGSGGTGGAGGGGGATGGDGGSSTASFAADSGDGGGIFLTAGNLTLTRTTLSENSTGAGGAGGAGGTGGAGGSGSTTGGDGGDSHGGQGGRSGFGGGVFFSSAGVATITDTVIRANHTGVGGAGGAGGTGGAAGSAPGFGAAGDGFGGAGGSGGDAPALDIAGDLTLTGSAIVGNQAGTGGPGGSGGAGASGVAGTKGSSHGGLGGSGGSSTVLIASGSADSLTNATIASNKAGAGGGGGAGGTGPNNSSGGNGGGGGAEPGLRTLVFQLDVTHATIALNEIGLGGTGGAAGTGAGTNTAGANGQKRLNGGIGNTNPPRAITLRNSVIASNNANGAANCFGPFDPASAHNLSFPDDGSCPADLHGDPLLGAPLDNGGPTPTVALGPGSPAVDAVPASGAGCTPTDQRGLARPKGAGCDIGAFEQSLPRANTGPVSAITETSATVGGTVNPGERATSYDFEFGKTTAYGSSTPPTSAGAGTADVTVSESLTGLDPGTTYHYRLVATNGDGTSAGSDAIVTTPAAPVVQPPPSPPSPPSPPFAFPGVRILTARTTVDRKGRAGIRLSCPALTDRSCDGTLSLVATIASKRTAARTRRLALGRKRFSIKPGKAATVNVKLSKAGLKALRKLRKLKATATAVAHDGAGTRKTRKRAVIIKARRSRRSR